MGNTACFQKKGMENQVVDTPGDKRKKRQRDSQRNTAGIQNTMGTLQESKQTGETLTASVRTNSLAGDADLQDSTSRPVSQSIAKGKTILVKEAANDIDSDDGNMLNDLDNGDIDFEKEEAGDTVEDVDKLFGLGNSQMQYNRVTRNFQIAKSRALNALNTNDYLLSSSKRIEEEPLSNVTTEALEKALFYMYGACESVFDEEGNHHVIHNLLRRYQIWSGQLDEVKKYLGKQIVISMEDDADEDLSQTENIIKFLNTHSRFGKNVREIEEIGETLSSTLYKVVGSSEQYVIKVPKKIENQDEVAFFDIIYQTQLMQFLKDNRKDGEKQFFPSVREEIFVVNKNTRTVLNYVTFVDYAQSSLINMLDGPTAGVRESEQFDEEGYRSQEIFTQEKFAYLYYKGLSLLEFLFENGMTHGHINANSLRIDDDYTFTLSDFPISTVTPNFSKMSPEEQNAAKVKARGFNIKTISDEIKAKLEAQGAEESKADEKRSLEQEFFVKDLIQEDWRDMVGTFFFPRLGKMITDQRIRQFIDSSNRELLEEGQEVVQIRNIVQKAHRFILGNIWILEDLIGQLKDEQMFEAVDSIGEEIFELGVRMENVRLQAFAQLTLGEIASQEHIEDEARADRGIEQLLAVNELYQQDAQILDTEEYARLCTSLSVLYRQAKKDTSQAKKWLELAKDKIKDKRVLMTFYMETAQIFSNEGKHHQALDSNQKAIQLAELIYSADDYAMFELQITLAECYEKCEEREQAEAIFNKCFQQMDGRDGQSIYSRGMSIHSKLSKALSIKSKGTSIVMYGQRRSTRLKAEGGAAADQAKNEKAGAMQRVAVQLRQKQEYDRAQKLMIKAISVKKQIVGSEINDDIAYLYNELAVTYHGNDDYENACKCIKKQLLIWDQLKQNQTMEYAQVLCFLGEIYRDLEMPNEAISALDKSVRLMEIVEENNQTLANSQVSGVVVRDQMALERSGIMKILAEEQIKAGKVNEGIRSAEGALFLQKQFYSNMINFQVQETMLLLAEAYTVDQKATKALQVYQQILDARTDGFGSTGEPTKDIFRKMAPLYTSLGNFDEASESLKQVIEQETQEILKVGLYTKLAGNLKKSNKKDECIEVSQKAYELMKQLSGEKDAQTCRCLINLAQVYQHFEEQEQAKSRYEQYKTMYEAQNGADGTQNWSQMEQFNKLYTFVEAQLEEMENAEGEGEAEEGYYDEEDAAGEGGEEEEGNEE